MSSLVDVAIGKKFDWWITKSNQSRREYLLTPVWYRELRHAALLGRGVGPKLWDEYLRFYNLKEIMIAVEE